MFTLKCVNTFGDILERTYMIDTESELRDYLSCKVSKFRTSIEREDAMINLLNDIISENLHVSPSSRMSNDEIRHNIFYDSDSWNIFMYKH